MAELGAALRACLREDRVPIPPYPAVAAKLQALAAREDHAVRDVAAVVAADATLAATALRCASRAGLGESAPVETIDEAVRELGAAELLRLSIATSVGHVALARGPLLSLRRERWRSSLLAGMLCQELAGPRGLRPDLAFLAGLLHDLGAVVALACLEESAQAHPLPPLPEATWRQLAEGFHVELGSLVAARWQLPEPVTEAIAHHHDVDASVRLLRPLVQLVHVVDELLALLTHPPTHDDDPLAAIASLTEGERELVRTLVPIMVERLGFFEALGATATPPAPSKVQHEPDLSQGSWPVDFAVTVQHRSETFHAVFLSPNLLGLAGSVALPPNWLTLVELATPAGAASFTANVKACEVLGPGRYLVVVQPFGLDGTQKAKWLELVTQTRHAAGLATGPHATVAAIDGP